jgi:hypothetical protein
MSYTIVVARYKEDTSWLSSMDPGKVLVYTKSGEPNLFQNSISLQNWGRESETYLRYICDHYDSLPSYIVFIQGNPFDHIVDKRVSVHNFRESLEALVGSRPTEAISIYNQNCEEPMATYPGLRFQEYFSLLFDSEIPTQKSYPPGCQYVVPRDVILSRSKQFWIKIHSMIFETNFQEAHETWVYDPDRMTPWTFERLAPYIFSSKIKSRF